MKRSILFVDDEESILASYRMMFSGAWAGEWEVFLARSGPEALAIMSERQIGIVITDMRMPGMSGAQLLTEVVQRFPKTVRFVLSGYAEQEQVAQCLGAAHQFLTKPCSLQLLLSTVQRACALDVCLENEGIKELVSSMRTVPSMPTLYFRILQELQSPASSLDRIAAVIAADPAMSAKLLQLVNSAFYGLARRISTPAEAILLLGVETVRSLTLSVHAFSCFDQKLFSEFRVESVWKHCFHTGRFAKSIAQFETVDSTIIEEAFMAGLLHDIGKLMFVANLPQQYRAVTDMTKRSGIPLRHAEQEIFNCTHADVGGYLLGLWGLPITIVEAVALHHRPSDSLSTAFSPLAAVHAANALAHQSQSVCDHLTHIELDEPYLITVCGKDRLNFWRQNVQRGVSKAA